MGHDLKYGEVFHRSDPENYTEHDDLGIKPLGHDDEPLIVFRAQDVLTVPLIARYANLYTASQPDGFNPTESEFLKSLRDVADTFERWQKENPDKVKMPD